MRNILLVMCTLLIAPACGYDEYSPVGMELGGKADGYRDVVLQEATGTVAERAVVLISKETVTCPKNPDGSWDLKGHCKVDSPMQLEDKLPSSWSGDVDELCPALKQLVTQPVYQRCSSGSLVEKDLVLAAAHAFLRPDDCRDQVFIFDYRWTPGSDYSLIPAAHVYHCKKVIAWSIALPLDFALLQLDREVKDRTPLQVSDAMSLPGEERAAQLMGTSVMLLGHPSGLPLKVSSGEVVKMDSEMDYNEIESTNDAFAGFSGGPLLDADNRLLGVLSTAVGGGDDKISSAFAWFSDKACLGWDTQSETQGNSRVSSSPVLAELIEAWKTGDLAAISPWEPLPPNTPGGIFGIKGL